MVLNPMTSVPMRHPEERSTGAGSEAVGAPGARRGKEQKSPLEPLEGA